MLVIDFDHPDFALVLATSIGTVAVLVVTALLMFCCCYGIKRCRQSRKHRQRIPFSVDQHFHPYEHQNVTFDTRRLINRQKELNAFANEKPPSFRPPTPPMRQVEPLPSYLPSPNTTDNPVKTATVRRATSLSSLMDGNDVIQRQMEEQRLYSVRQQGSESNSPESSSSSSSVNTRDYRRNTLYVRKGGTPLSRNTTHLKAGTDHALNQRRTVSLHDIIEMLQETPV